MFGQGVPELLIIALIILLIFGAKRFPSIGEFMATTPVRMEVIPKHLKVIVGSPPR